MHGCARCNKRDGRLLVYPVERSTRELHPHLLCTQCSSEQCKEGCACGKEGCEAQLCGTKCLGVSEALVALAAQGDKVVKMREHHEEEVLKWERGESYDDDWLRAPPPESPWSYEDIPHFVTQKGNKMRILAFEGKVNVADDGFATIQVDTDWDFLVKVARKVAEDDPHGIIPKHKVKAPRAWEQYGVGPHVSLDPQSAQFRNGERARVVATDVDLYWDYSGWVVLKVNVGTLNGICKDGDCHMSIGQVY
jgi:hypothetical protein